MAQTFKTIIKDEKYRIVLDKKGREAEDIKPGDVVEVTFRKLKTE